MRWGRAAQAATAVTVALLLGGGGATGPASAAPRASCPSEASSVLFVGRVERTEGDVATFHVLELRRGTLPGPTATLTYPDAPNVRFLRVGQRYLVGTTAAFGAYRSIVPSADQPTACETLSTRHADGTAIETGAFTDAKHRLPRIGRLLAVGVAGSLLLLILFGRLLDRRSLYR